MNQYWRSEVLFCQSEENRSSFTDKKILWPYFQNYYLIFFRNEWTTESVAKLSLNSKIIVSVALREGSSGYNCEISISVESACARDEVNYVLCFKKKRITKDNFRIVQTFCHLFIYKELEGLNMWWYLIDYYTLKWEYLWILNLKMW